jgi:RNA polymerase sigma-70 factor (ECF subfamily)
MTIAAHALEPVSLARTAAPRGAPLPVADQPRHMPALSRVDARRFERLVAANLDFIWRCVRRLGIPARDVDDAVQQVFLVAATKLPAIVVGSERAFLFSTASRVAANMGRLIRRRSRTIVQAAGPEPPDSLSDEPSPEEVSDMLRARELMDRILDEMPDPLREVFVLFELEELPVAEVAAVLSVPIGTVGSRLRRARADFQQRARRLARKYA